MFIFTNNMNKRKYSSQTSPSYCSSPAYSPSSPRGSSSTIDIDPEISKLGTQDWCVTQVQVSKVSFVWTVMNFGVCSKMGENLTSSEFQDSTGSNCFLCLNLENSYNIELKLMSSFAGNIRTNFSFLNSKGDKITLSESQNDKYSHYGQQAGTYLQRFKKDDLRKHDLLYGDKLTIFVLVKAITDKTNKTSQSFIPHFRDPECKIIENFASILKEGKFSDVTLTVNGQNLRAHKAILAARSKVFAAMFDHEMKENDTNTVIITDINHNVVKEMLHFIYTGEAPNVDQMAHELFAAADKYDIKVLRSMCEVALYRTLDEETAAETLILADLHGAKQLKEQTINFIKLYANVVEKTQGWQKLLKEHPELITENDQEKSLCIS